jgi:hypothetical protein
MQNNEETDQEVPIIENTDSKKPTRLAGYKAKELLKAPFTIPEPDKTEGKEYTNNPRVTMIIATGSLIGLAGLFFTLFSYMVVGMLFATIGAILVFAGVFVPIH